MHLTLFESFFLQHIEYIVIMSDESKQTGDNQLEDPSMSVDPEERGKQLGHNNAHGGQSVGTGGHGTRGGIGT